MTWESRVLSPWCGFESTRFSAFTDREAVRPEDSHLDCECSGTVLPESPEEHGESTVRWSVETPHHLQGPEISDYKILREMLGRFNALTSVSNFANAILTASRCHCSTSSPRLNRFGRLVSVKVLLMA